VPPLEPAYSYNTRNQEENCKTFQESHFEAV
jgi:hypothetical protein